MDLYPKVPDVEPCSAVVEDDDDDDSLPVEKKEEHTCLWLKPSVTDDDLYV